MPNARSRITTSANSRSSRSKEIANLTVSVNRRLLAALTSGSRRTSAIKFASNGEVLSLLHARVRGTFKSTTAKTTTV
jgi:hypothetical protein